MTYYGRQIKLPQRFLSSKPPSLQIQLELDKIMSTLIIEQQPQQSNQQLLQQFVFQNKLQKVEAQQINRLYLQYTKRKMKREKLNCTIKPQFSQMKNSNYNQLFKTQTQCQKVVQSMQENKNKLKKNRENSKRQRSWYQKKINENFNAFPKQKAFKKAKSSSKIQYFGSQALGRSSNSGHFQKYKSQLCLNNKLNPHSQYNDQKYDDCSQHIRQRNQFQCMYNYIQKFIKLDKDQAEQLIQLNRISLNQKQRKRLKKMQDIQKQKLKYQIYRSFQSFGLKTSQLKKNIKLHYSSLY